MPSNRRTTLGPTTVDRNRKSLGAAGGKNKSSKSGRQRKSMAPRVCGGESLLPDEENIGNSVTPSRRKVQRKSIGTSGMNGAGLAGSDRRQTLVPMRSDSRPISDKSYINSSIRSLMRYLVASGYDQTLSHKILSRPSGKDFNHIITFLIRRVDPNFNDGSLKFEDEVSHAFKSFGYPFNISKTALVAVGSPHTWPGLLAALTWLIELLHVHEGEAQSSAIENESGAKRSGNLEEMAKLEEKAFCNFVIGAYEAFLLCYDEQGKVLEDDLVGTFEKNNEEILLDAERVTDLNATVVEEINKLAEREVELPELEKKREDYCADLEKFDELIKKLRDHKDISIKKVKDRQKEFQNLDNDLQNLNSRLSEMKRGIESQGISVDEARRMQNEAVRLQQGIEKTVAAKEDNQKNLWECEMELSQKIEELEAAVLRYNAKLPELNLFPQSAENAKGKKLSIDVAKRHTVQADQTELLGGIDVNGMVNEHLRDLKDATLTEIRFMQQELSTLKKQEFNAEKEVSDASELLKHRKETKTKKKEAYAREEEEQAIALEALLKDVELLQTKISSARDPVALEEAIERYQNKCTELEFLRKKRQEENVLKKRAVHEEIETALSLFSDHKEHVSSKISEAHEYVEQKWKTLQRPSKHNRFVA